MLTQAAALDHRFAQRSSKLANRACMLSGSVTGISYSAIDVEGVSNSPAFLRFGLSASSISESGHEPSGDVCSAYHACRTSTKGRIADAVALYACGTRNLRISMSSDVQFVRLAIIGLTKNGIAYTACRTTRQPRGAIPRSFPSCTPDLFVVVSRSISTGETLTPTPN